MNIFRLLYRVLLLVIVPLASLTTLSYLNNSSLEYADAFKVGIITVWLTLWWATGIVPLGVTSFLPILLFPTFGILESSVVFHAYANPIIFLFLGGFLLAIAVQQSGLHTRIAINIMLSMGYSPHLLILGIMLVTAFVSMIMSNTVTALMMFPITTGLCMLFTEASGDTVNQRSIRNFTIVAMLAVAYSASIGGMATIIGSPPNAITVGVIEELLGKTITFTQWFSIGFPIMLLLLCITWIVLLVCYPVTHIDMGRVRAYLMEEKRSLNRMKKEEKAIIVIGSFLILGWIADDTWNIPILALLSDTQVSLLGVVLLFSIRVDGKPLLDTTAFSKVEWNILYMFGAGFALSAASALLPLNDIFSDIFSSFSNLPPYLMAIIFCLFAGFTTELTSNSSVTILLLPIVFTLAPHFELMPLYTMLGICYASSCAFMFPASTPSNAIVFGSGYLKIIDLMKVGFILTIVSGIFLGLYSYLIIPILGG